MSDSNEVIRLAVVGVGRMGHQHARTYDRLDGAELLAVVDSDPNRCQIVADELQCDACRDWQQLLDQHPHIRAVSVAVPTAHHVTVAAPLLERGIACLVEKPLAASTAEAERLADLAEKYEAIVQVGHTERFNPAVQALAAMEITPRFIEVHRVSPMSFRSLDIGVVMDLMIHDLDLILMFARSPLVRVDATGVAVLAEHEDVANARLVFQSGCVVNLTASRLALKTERRLRIFSDEAYVSLDYLKRSGVVLRKSGNAAALEAVRARIAAGKDLSHLDYAQLLQIEPLVINRTNRDQDPLTAQLTSFVNAVRTGQRPAVDAAAGTAAVEAAERVVAALREHRWEGLAEPRV